MNDARAHSGVHRLAVVGVGMMGGSLALAARNRGRVDEVVGFDTDQAALNEALEKGVITEAAGTAAEAAAYADLVVISTPVRSIPQLVEECAASEPRPRLITDMGSTKSAIMASLSPEAKALFIGGHPMCGASDSGVRYARPDLFDGSTYFLCTTGAAFPKLYAMLQQFILDLGAKPNLIDPVAHDQIMAVISHLPHVLANVLMDHAGACTAGGKRALQWVGASFTDLTRVAGANPPMWRDIFLENRAALGESVIAVAAALQEFAARLLGVDESAIEQDIESAATYRQEMLEFADIIPETLYKVTVRVPDQPGSISRVMTALGEAGINVEDLTLHHMSRSMGGDLVLFVTGEDVAEQTAALLNGLDYPSRVSFLGDSSE
ncbi:MAG: prephenate dehydrogenase/arogenate dehydrogenase family protein [Actinobacteria bacterium]|jgi:prephenate dehydrogenase|nr:prephenate dehydrogenase/arogenate dehydrogenase family protein [Actinomycetota bacterium]